MHCAYSPEKNDELTSIFESSSQQALELAEFRGTFEVVQAVGALIWQCSKQAYGEHGVETLGH